MAMNREQARAMIELEENEGVCPYSTYAHICIPTEGVAACRNCAVRKQMGAPQK